MSIEHRRIVTPVGPLHVYACAGTLVLIAFGTPAEYLSALARRFPGERIGESTDPAGAVTALQRYFSGDLASLESLGADPGGTPFQGRVWQALRRVAPGSTISYQELARRIAAPAAVRAVGAANGANPIPIVIPCHRVIGATGRLVGYGGGLDRKDWLLRHEGWRPLAPHV